MNIFKKFHFQSVKKKKKKLNERELNDHISSLRTFLIKVNNKLLNSSTLATSCEELTHWKRLWCWEGLGAGGEGGNRGWGGWMASWTRWTWVWVNSRRWWWTGRPGVLRFMGLQRVGHDWTTELNWIECTCFSGILSNHPTLNFSHWVQKSVLYFCVSFAALLVGLLVPSF